MRYDRVRIHLLLLLLLFSSGAAFSQAKWERLSEANRGEYTGIVGLPDGRVAAYSDHGSVAFSTDNGQNWTASSTGLPQTTVRGITSHPIYGIFAATDKGLFRFSESANEWHATNIRFGLSAVAFDSVGVLYVGVNKLDAPKAPAGVYSSSDGGAKWMRAGLDNQNITFLYAGSGVLYAGTAGNGLYASYNSGSGWMQTPLESGWITCFTQTGDQTLFAGTLKDGFFRSMNGGSSWEAANNGLVDKTIKSVVADERGMLFVATYVDGVYTSPNFGDSWMECNNDLADRKTNALLRTGAGTLIVTTPAGLFRTNDPYKVLKNGGSLSDSSLIGNAAVTKTRGGQR